MSCDLITDIDLHEILNVYRNNNASLVSLYFSPSQDEQCVFTTPGPKSKNKLGKFIIYINLYVYTKIIMHIKLLIIFNVIEKDIVGYDSRTSRLLLMASASDYEETMPLSSSLLYKCSNFTLCAKLLDSHMYIMKHWIISYLVKDK